MILFSIVYPKAIISFLFNLKMILLSFKSFAFLNLSKTPVNIWIYQTENRWLLSFTRGFEMGVSEIIRFSFYLLINKTLISHSGTKSLHKMWYICLYIKEVFDF